MITRRQLDAFAHEYASKLGSPVSPRYLAGPGDPRHVTHALCAAGWSVPCDPLHPAIRMQSPDQQHELVFKPSAQYTRAWWTVHSGLGPDHWYAAFSGDTPVEIVAALTDTLLLPEPEGSAREGFAAVLAKRGWEHTTDVLGSHRIVSPDRTVLVEQRISPSMGRCGWEIEVARHRGPYGPEGRLWRASLDIPPGHVLGALATALSDPAPVPRPRFAIDESPHLTVGREVVIGEQIVAAHQERLAQARRPRPATTPVAAKPTPHTPAIAPPARSR
ncbi:DUF317 domain-containing protein [Streptomyces sp. CC208A]|uniref:DUF317 domain-containing protein n=1 Tax=Streptomyces sp. CC208A TaxID=3044573 RepID=UPI0024A9DA99|nr:DUF317 domain-containing protein [Streptomyces sp. CC208A]